MVMVVMVVMVLMIITLLAKMVVMVITMVNVMVRTVGVQACRTSATTVLGDGGGDGDSDAMVMFVNVHRGNCGASALHHFDDLDVHCGGASLLDKCSNHLR